MSEVTHAPKAGLGQVLKAQHQHWSHTISPENVGLDFSMPRYVFLLASIFPRLGTGNMAEIIIKCKQDGGEPQTVCVKGTQLVCACCGRNVLKVEDLNAKVLLRVGAMSD